MVHFKSSLLSSRQHLGGNISILLNVLSVSICLSFTSLY